MGWSPGLGRALAECRDPNTIVHLHGLWAPSSLAFQRWRRRRGVGVVSPHGMLDPWALAHSKRRKQLALWLYERGNLESAACLHASSASELESIRRFGLRGPAVLLPNGIELPPETAAAPLDPAPADGKDQKVLLFLGRIHPKKGLLPLVEGWARVAREAPRWRLAIAGPDEIGHAAEVERAIARHGVSATVRLVGPQFGAGKDAWLRRAEAFVLPSHSEGFPMALLEAMSYRLPVVMTPACNFPEAAAAGAAILVDPHPEGIARGLGDLFRRTEDERRSMGAKGRALVEEGYSWDAIAERFAAVYQWILGRGPRPSEVDLDGAKDPAASAGARTR